MITGNRLRERRATPIARSPSAPVPAAVPDPVEQAEKIRQLEVECTLLRGSLVAMERRAVDAEARAQSTHDELMRLSTRPKEQAQPAQLPTGQQRGKR